MQDAIILLVIFSVPLVAILGRTFIKYKQIELEGGRGASGDTVKRLDALERENVELRARVETLETIATGGDARSLGMEGAHKLKELEAHQEVGVSVGRAPR